MTVEVSESEKVAKRAVNYTTKTWEFPLCADAPTDGLIEAIQEVSRSHLEQLTVVLFDKLKDSLNNPDQALQIIAPVVNQ